MEDEFVPVYVLGFVTTVPGLTLRHIVRPHEGDRFTDWRDDEYRIEHGQREVVTGNSTRTVPGKVVSIPRHLVVEYTHETRYERRVRPSVAELLDRKTDPTPIPRNP